MTSTVWYFVVVFSTQGFGFSPQPSYSAACDTVAAVPAANQGQVAVVRVTKTPSTYCYAGTGCHDDRQDMETLKCKRIVEKIPAVPAQPAREVGRWEIEEPAGSFSWPIGGYTTPTIHITDEAEK